MDMDQYVIQQQMEMDHIVRYDPEDGSYGRIDGSETDPIAGEMDHQMIQM